MTSRAKPAKKAPSGIFLPDEHLFFLSTATETQENQGQKKKIPTLGTPAQRLHSCFLIIDVAARTAHLMTAGSVEYAFEGAFCGKANGV
jgi:hypothetical protein